MFKNFVKMADSVVEKIAVSSKHGIEQKRKIEELEEEKNSLLEETFKAEQDKKEMQQEIHKLSEQMGVSYDKDKFKEEFESLLKKGKVYIDSNELQNEIYDMMKDILK